MEQNDFEHIVDSIIDLPTLPQVVTTLINAINDPKSDAAIINKIVEHDPALAARILKLVNSSFYSLSKPVDSIQQAVVILGFNTIRSLSISASVFSVFTANKFSYEGFWKQSLACAFMMDTLSKYTSILDKDATFTVGLLHGIGKIIIEQYAPEKFDEILRIGHRQLISYNEAEKNILNTSYTNLGYWLTEKWSLSETIQESILYQNNPDEAPAKIRVLTAAAQFAFKFARYKGCENGSDFNKAQPPKQELWDMFEIADDDTPEVIANLESCIEAAENALNALN